MTANRNGTASPATAREAALRYHKQGWVPLPLPHLKKRPALPDWSNFRFELSALDEHFPAGGEQNIGLLLGAPSNGLIDVDLDCPEARAAATFLLPKTDMIGGRVSAPDSHWWYIVDSPPEKSATDFDDPTRLDNDPTHHMLEIRSTGGQTVVPPSIYPVDLEKGHPEPERCVWSIRNGPTRISFIDLRVAVRAVGAAALLGRYWPKGSRNKAALALAGGLLRANWEAEKVENFIRAMCAAAKDEEVENRIATVAATAEKLAKSENVCGWPSLMKILGQIGSVIVSQVWDWLGIAPTISSATPRKVRVLAPYAPFPVEALPNTLRAFTIRSAEALGCDPAYIALPALTVAASCIGNTRTIRLKRGWDEPSVVWSVLVGDSGTLKSPAFKSAVRHLYALQEQYLKVYRVELEEWNEQMKEWKATDPEERGERPTRPVLRKIICSDTTIEKLAEILEDNPRGVLVARDELAGWLGSFARYKGKSGGSDLPNWLEMSTAGTIMVDRKTGDRPALFVKRAAASVVGGIQPGVMVRALTPEFLAAGLGARLLMAMPPKILKRWTEIEVEADIEAAYHATLDGLLALEFDTRSGEQVPHALKLSPEGKVAWVKFYNEWAGEQSAVEGELAAAFSKLEGYAARFALLHHVIERVARDDDDLVPIEPESIAAGVTLCRWYAQEARRIYSTLTESDEECDTRRLVEFIQGRGGSISIRELQRSNNRKYPDKVCAEAALEALVVAGLGTWRERATPKGGNPARIFDLCTTHDSCDTCPDDDDDHAGEGEDGMHDSPPHRTTVDTPPATAVDNANTSNDRAYVAARPEDGEQVSQVSCCHAEPPEPEDTEPQTTSPGGEAQGSTVVQPGLNGVRDSREPTYRLVTDQAGLREVSEGLCGVTLLGVDTETTGLDHATDRVRLLSLASPKVTFLIDLFAISDPVSLAPVFGALSQVEVIGHNLGFDLPFLMRLGFTPGRVRDTILASQLLHAGDISKKHGLKDVTSRVLGLTLDKDLQKANWSGPLTPEMLRYAALDAEVPVRIWEKLTAEAATADMTEVLDIESAALPCIAWASVKGMGFDRQAWEALAGQAEAERGRLREELDAQAPNAESLFDARNWDSPVDVKAAFAALGLNLESTDDDALAEVDHPLAAMVRQYRSAAKRVGTYGREWLRHVAPNGRVYATWKQIGAGASGRMSCKEPNLQQLPRDLRYRRCFVAPPGRSLVKADYSQIELRIAAKITGDKRMLDAYRRGEDLHTLTARALLGKTEVAKADRQLAKAVNFGLLYGQGAEGLRRYALGSFGVSLTLEEATAHRETFFRTYPGLRAWHRKAGREPVETRTLAGRRRVGVARYTEKLNTPVQGTGADGLKRALGLLWQRRSTCPDAFPVLFVHDEIVVECPLGQEEEAAVWVRDAMRDGMAPLIDPIPVEVEVSAGPTWGG